MVTNYDQQTTKEEDFDFRRYGFFQKIWYYIHKFWEWIVNLYERSYPGPLFRKGAGIGALVLVVALSILLGITIQMGLWIVLDIPAGIFIVLTLFLVLIFVIGILFWIFLEIPKIIGRRGLIVMGSVGMMFFLFGFPILLAVILGILIVLVESVFGGTIALIFGKDFRYFSWGKKIWLVVVVGLILLFHVAGYRWVKSGGSGENLVTLQTVAGGKQFPQLKDPSLAGNFPVMKISYGSGADERREEFGKDAQIITEAVDVSRFMKNNAPLVKKIRKWYWGFDDQKFPLNGMVWFPKGAGPFPLVMVIHGTHRMTSHSHRGYEYLAELLAGKGFIVTSIDANFLNPSWSGSLKGEIQIRSWLIMKHLELWQKWNDNYENLFHGIVDMENIALVGHGTGAEAAVSATFLNRLKRHPDDASMMIPRQFHIKSVVGIAPTDGHYFPAARPIRFQNVNGLFIQGNYDARTSGGGAARYYNNLRFSDEGYWLKTLVHIRRANHNAFNSSWKRDDFGFPLNWIMNRNALLDAADQQLAAKSYIAAFLEITLKGNYSYIPLLRNHHNFTQWLPRDIYGVSFQDSRFRPLCTFEEDFDVTSGTSPAVQIDAGHVSTWREGDAKRSLGETGSNQAVFLRWIKNDGGSQLPRYSVSLPENFIQPGVVNEDSLLVFSMADCRDVKPDGSGEISPQTVMIKLFFDAGDVDLPLSKFGSVPVPFCPQISKLKWEHLFFKKESPLLFQTFECPLSIFLEKNPQLDISKLNKIQFMFDNGSDGHIAIDNIGFTTFPVQ